MNIENMTDLQLQSLMKNAEPFRCTTCDGIYYKQVVVLNRISKLLTASTHDTIIPQQSFLCDTCGTPFGLEPESLPQPEEENEEVKETNPNNIIKL